MPYCKLLPNLPAAPPVRFGDFGNEERLLHLLDWASGLRHGGRFRQTICACFGPLLGGINHQIVQHRPAFSVAVT
jgi:hypothetical protein